ncbi:hypothetical protein [Protofrankia coriariae]|uniref:Uncharacterized protein n=1 Tax=Protofrankia coriariae TaxID=1562887 RepID=A0ABR5F1N7_9ACTN|nr:hypothetical protein [Protofrankia coriariae]KLL10630.1 hypothetical protein FrCorBMG51_16740 [Protofrankia coriariae]
MSRDAFTFFFTNEVGATVDAAIDDPNQLEADGVRTVVDWWKGLGPASRALVTVVAGLGGSISSAVLGRILTPAVGEFIAVCLSDRAVGWGVVGAVDKVLRVLR